MQIFDVDINNPVLTLDAVNGTLKINDFAGDKCRDQCPAVPLAYYSDRTTIHVMEITFGPSGRIDYAIWDTTTGYEVFEYHGTGNLGGNSSYLKYGFYRSTYQGMSSISGGVGDFYYQRI